MKPILSLALSLAVTLASPALAERDDFDPRIILDAVAQAYRDEAVTEDIRVTVETISEKRIERMTLRTRPGEGAEITLGPLTIWTNLDHWFAVHKDAPDHFVRVPIEGGDAIETLRDAFPPIIAPTLVWALGEADDPPCALLEGVEWTSGRFELGDATASRLFRWVAKGEADGRNAILITDGGRRFVELTIEDPASGTTITARRTESHAPRKATLGVGIEHREALPSLRALLERIQPDA